MRTMQSALFFLLLSIVSVIADSDSGSGDDSTDGLSGGAIAGIIIGTLAVLGAIGGAVYYYLLRDGAKARGRMMYSDKAPDGTASRFGDNHLPMMAMPVSGDDDL